MPDRRKKQQNKKTQPVSRALLFLPLLVLFMGLAGWQLLVLLEQPDTFPMKVVKIEGDVKHLDLKVLEKTVAPKVSGGFFNIDLMSVKQTAKQLPWVKDVFVVRQWPDTLVMRVTERVAIARWGTKGLVTAEGLVFYPRQQAGQELPLIVGSQQQAVELVKKFIVEKRRFAQSNLEIVEMRVDARGSWKLKFANGLSAALGSEDVDAKFLRLARYIGVINRIKGMPQKIDLRYHHGMSVSWPVSGPGDMQKEHKKMKKGAA